MKKIYLLLSTAVITTAVFAQYRSVPGAATMNFKKLLPKVIKTTNDKAAGDSLIYFDSEAFLLTNAQDSIDFAFTNQDFDNGTPMQTNWPTNFMFSFFDTDAAKTPYTTPGGNFFPHDVTSSGSGTDTSFFIGASSWFNISGPPLQANNWWNFGPITIPANTTGNTFNWFDKNNSAYTDSYKLYVVNMNNVSNPANPDGPVDVTANSLTPNFSRTQITPPTPQPSTDTSWTMQSVNIDAFVGQRIFIYFHHDAILGRALFLDEMWVQEGNLTTGIEELNTASFNVYPNPSKGEFNINLTANQANNVSMVVRDVIGKTVVDRVISVSGQKTEKVSLTDYSKGIYFLTIENKTVKLIVE